jgi:flagellar biosynthesis GTPase FlhF
MAVLKSFFLLCFLALILVCRAGLLNDVKHFFGKAYGKLKSSGVVGSSDAAPSLEDLLSELKYENGALRDQVSSLKSMVIVQKKQLIEEKKEKEALRKLLASQVEDLTRRMEVDTEKIKKELLANFQEEKEVMKATFEEEKQLLKEAHEKELDELKDTLTKKAKKAAAEVKSLKNMSEEQAKEILEYKKKQAEALKVGGSSGALVMEYALYYLLLFIALIHE